MGKITKRILANIFFFLLIFQSLSAQNSQRIDLSLKEQTLKVFLEIVEQKTNYTFMYNNLDLEQKISVQVKQATIDELLKKALTPLHINFEIANAKIILTKQDQVNNGSVTVTVKGSIVDEAGEPLIGVNIAAMSTGKGTISDINGDFTVEAAKNEILNISYIGYVSQQIKVGTQSSIHVILKEDTQTLDEVVVTALGICPVQKRH